MTIATWWGDHMLLTPPLAPDVQIAPDLKDLIKWCAGTNICSQNPSHPLSSVDPFMRLTPVVSAWTIATWRNGTIYASDTSQNYQCPNIAPISWLMKDVIIKWSGDQPNVPKTLLNPNCHHSILSSDLLPSPSCNLCLDRSHMASYAFVGEHMTAFTGVSSLNIQSLSSTCLSTSTVLSWFCLHKHFLSDKKVINRSLVLIFAKHQIGVPLCLSDVFIRILLVLYAKVAYHGHTSVDCRITSC